MSNIHLLGGLWANGRTRFTASNLTTLPLPISTKQYLLETGLPQTPREFPVQFVHSAEELTRCMCNALTYICVGNSNELPICLQENTGAVFSLEERGEISRRFINSGIETFICFLELYYQVLPALYDANDAQAQNIGQTLEAKFKAVDARAMSYDENWWPVILEQISDGLL